MHSGTDHDWEGDDTLDQVAMKLLVQVNCVCPRRRPIGTGTGRSYCPIIIIIIK